MLEEKKPQLHGNQLDGGNQCQNKDGDFDNQVFEPVEEAFPAPDHGTASCQELWERIPATSFGLGFGDFFLGSALIHGQTLPPRFNELPSGNYADISPDA